ncbi:TonB-dependent receptor [Cellulophaga sp. Hel_I_12]|uniref:SusC/RagA family TonB-linked outer membrane protein n=1 Tax=Cellulophaga sp. Hel_I_12 TaxID=1249972 RepID=UPI00068D75D2|nr:TonB-dependent receptor [Cellulophaga sp. Hel_I_12]
MKHQYFKDVIKKVLFFCLMLFSLGIYAQETIVSGKIISSDGMGLPGANVFQKGTTNGVVADFDGNYQITLKKGSNILVYTYVGYEDREEAISGRSVINVTLLEDTESLDEVVVIGYGSQKKSDITGAVSSVKSEDLEKAIFNTVDQLLQGRSSGVIVTSASGEPGSNSSIRIRGNNSISGNNAPLYVVDGIPINGTPAFNPTEISNIEILKDASATAIYGSRGSNGVILITTKKGKVGKVVIDVNIDTSISSVTSSLDMLNGQDYAAYRNEAAGLQNNPIPFPNPEQYAGQGFDWQDEIIGSGLRNNIGVNLSGGSDDIRFFLATNLLDDKGIVLNSRFSRGTLRANLGADVFNDKLKFDFGISLAHSQGNQAVSATRGFPSSLGPITNALLSEPLVPSLDYSGLAAEGAQFFNPYLEVTEKDDRTFNTDILFNTKISWDITKNLSYTFNGGINFRNDVREIFYPSTVGQGIIPVGVATSNTGRAYDYVVSNYFDYSKMFNDIHDFSATAGLEYSEFNNYAFNTNVSNFELEILGLDNVGIGTSLNNIGSGRSLAVLQSGFFRLQYAYKEKYLLTATARADGSSRFSQNRKWGYFPSVSLGWNIAKENFLKESKTINNLKLRGSYGEVGSQSIAPYQSLARYGTTQYPIGNSPSLGFIPTSVENPNLKWETTEQLNVGLDLGLLKDRITFTAEYYKKTTRDLLQSIQLPSQSGFGGALVNFGSIENAGFEFDLNAYVIQKEKFTWDTSFNISFNKNKVLELGGDEEIFGPGIGANFIGGAHIYRPGDEFGLFWGYIANGLIQQSDLDAAAASGTPLPARNNDRQLGHWLLEDREPDGVINQNDKTIIGNPNPDYVFGWNNDFTFKNFTLNVFIQGSQGNDILNALRTITNMGFDNNESYKNQTVDWYRNRWTPENPTNNILYPSINTPSPDAGNYMVEDGSYIRLKNLSLRYSIPSNNLGFSAIQVFVTGTNLFTITNYSGFDPEVSSLGANTLAPGVDLGVYPRQQSYTLGVNLKF